MNVRAAARNTFHVSRFRRLFATELVSNGLPVTEEEGQEFQENFDKRKVELGSRGRPKRATAEGWLSEIEGGEFHTPMPARQAHRRTAGLTRITRPG